MRPLRVLHFIYASEGEGAERQLSLILGEAGRAGMHGGVFFVQGSEGPFQHSGVTVYRGRRLRRIPFELPRQMLAAIRDFNPDVIHTWLPEVITVPAMLLAKLHRIPCVASYRGQKK